MPESRFAEIVILAEDRVQVRFIRSWLTKHVAHRNIKNRFAVDGSGEQFVREHFADEARNHFRNAKKRSSMLIAVIDADSGEAVEHYRELKSRAQSDEGVFVFVPKRNIETWLRQLNDDSANEVDDYKSSYRSETGQAIFSAGEKFLKHVRSRPESDDRLLPSLALGVKEARRIPRLHEPANR